jgi:hypothetical protein
MRLLLLSLVCVLLLIPCVASSQYVIGIRGTEWNESCWKDEPVDGGIIKIIVYLFPGDHPISSVQFRLVNGDGFTGQYVGERLLVEGMTFGNSQDGILILKTCQQGDIMDIMALLEVTYMTYGTSAPCSVLSIEAHPGQGEIPPGLLVRDCGLIEEQCFVAGGGSLVVNPHTEGADCVYPCLATVPAQESTWGQIKELYKE